MSPAAAEPESPDAPDAQRSIALLRELGLLGGAPDPRPQAGTVEAALAALVRSAARACGGARAGLAVAGHDDSAWLACSDATPPPQAPHGEPVWVDAVHAATLFVQGQDRGPALRDLADLAGAVLSARLNERRAQLVQARVGDASRAGSDWLWETNPEGVLTWVSDSVEEHTGWPPSVEVGMHSLNLNRPPPGELRASWDRYRAARARRQPFSDGVGIRPTAHGDIMVAMSGRPAYDAEGRYIGYRGAARNVTAEQAERARADEAQRLLRDAIEAVSAGVMISDADGRVLISNAAWRHHLGPFAQGDGQTWEDMVREMVARGLYPEAVGREAAFIDWRLSLATHEGRPHELRLLDQQLLITDQRLGNGSVIHLSINVTEHARAQQELAREQARAVDSEARLAAVLHALPDLWFVLDDVGRYLQCSDDAHPWLVCPFDRLRGRRLDEVVPAAVAHDTHAAMARARATGQVQRFDYELQTPDGVQRSFEARVSPMPGGQLLYLTRDMTEARQLEREMRAMQRALEADAAVPMVVADALSAGLPLVYVNGAYERLCGQSRSALLNDPRGLLHWVDADPQALQTMRRALDEGRACQVTLDTRRADGTPAVTELSVAPVPDATGQLAQVIGVFNDVTERSRATRRLEFSESLYRSVASAIGDGLVIVGPDGTVLAVNPAGCRILGVDETSAVGLRLAQLAATLLTEDGSPLRGEQHPVHRVIHGGADVVDQLFQLQRSDQAVTLLRLSVQALAMRPEGGLVSCVLTFRDVTHARLAEQALRDKQAAELANRSKSEFLSRMSHEMRTPLNAVIGFAQLLQMQPGRAEGGRIGEYAGHMLHASEHLLALIDDVLDLQRVEEGRGHLQLRSVDLAALLEGTLGLLGPMADRHGVGLLNAVRAPVWVHADEQRLRQVLMNIVSNAIKYNRRGGWVRLSLGDATGPSELPCVALWIQDSGNGLSAEQLARLFQPFERLGHESSAIEGTGLGLVIARSLVEEMGGRLSLASHPGAGTRASIELASGRPDAAPVPTSPTAAPAMENAPMDDESHRTAHTAGSPPLRVLYVEDNRINAMLFEEALRLRGDVELQIAEDGAQALDCVRDWTPQLLVLDAHLPDMTGFEVLARLRAVPALAHTPAYMCSADAMPDDLQRASDAGFLGYWTKPIDMTRLMADLDRIQRESRA